MKKLLTIVILFSLIFSLAACNGNSTTATNSSNSAASESTPSPSPTPKLLDLAGGWKQSNAKSDENYQIAMIDNETIEVYWKLEGDSTFLYWAGSYVPPQDDSDEYSWESKNDKSRTDGAMLASGVDTKTFNYKNGTISYSVSAMGQTTTVNLLRSDEVNIEVKKAVSVEDLLPLELVESGFSVIDRSEDFIVHVAFSVKNPNKERGVEFPKIRLTVLDANGNLIGTEDVLGSHILPDGVWHHATQGPKTTVKPAKVDFEIIKPDDSDWTVSSEQMKDGIPLTVENPVKQGDKILGFISNPSKFEISSSHVIVFFRDENGKLLAGKVEYTDKISAGSKIPFEISLFGANRDYITDNFEVFAYSGY